MAQSKAELNAVLERGDVDEARHALAALTDALDVSDEALSDGAQRTLVAALEGNTTIRSIDVRGTGMSVEVVTALMELLKCRGVDMDNFDVWSRAELGKLLERCDVDEARRALAAVTGWLDLQDQVLSDGAQRTLVAALEGNTTVNEINVANTGLSVEVAVLLLESLQRRGLAMRVLHMGSNEFGDAEITAVANAFTGDSVVQALKLDRNKVGDAGAAALRAAIEHNATITEIDLSGNPCCDTEAGKEAIAAIESSCQVRKEAADQASEERNTRACRTLFNPELNLVAEEQRAVDARASSRQRRDKAALKATEAQQACGVVADTLQSIEHAHESADSAIETMQTASELLRLAASDVAAAVKAEALAVHLRARVAERAAVRAQAKADLEAAITANLVSSLQLALETGRAAPSSDELAQLISAADAQLAVLLDAQAAAEKALTSALAVPSIDDLKAALALSVAAETTPELADLSLQATNLLARLLAEEQARAAAQRAAAELSELVIESSAFFTAQLQDIIAAIGAMSDEEMEAVPHLRDFLAYAQLHVDKPDSSTWSCDEVVTCVKTLSLPLDKKPTDECFASFAQVFQTDGQDGADVPEWANNDDAWWSQMITQQLHPHFDPVQRQRLQSVVQRLHAHTDRNSPSARMRFGSAPEPSPKGCAADLALIRRFCPPLFFTLYEVESVLYRLSDGRPRVLRVLDRQSEQRTAYAVKLFYDDHESFMHQEKYLRELNGTRCVVELKQVFQDAHEPIGQYRLIVTRCGTPLLEYVQTLRDEGASPDKFMNLLREVGNALHELHSHGVVHNDFKAQQVVLVGEAHSPRLINLRACRGVGEPLPPQCTEMYAAPEVLQAHADSKAGQVKCDPKQVTWSFALVAFEILTGQSFFKDGASARAALAGAAKCAARQPSFVLRHANASFRAKFDAIPRAAAFLSAMLVHASARPSSLRTVLNGEGYTKILRALPSKVDGVGQAPPVVLL